MFFQVVAEPHQFCIILRHNLFKAGNRLGSPDTGHNIFTLRIEVPQDLVLTDGREGGPIDNSREVMMGDRRILVDTGIGDRWDDKKIGVFAIERRPNQLVAELAEAGALPGLGGVLHQRGDVVVGRAFRVELVELVLGEVAHLQLLGFRQVTAHGRELTGQQLDQGKGQYDGI